MGLGSAGHDAETAAAGRGRRSERDAEGGEGGGVLVRAAGGHLEGNIGGDYRTL